MSREDLSALLAAISSLSFSLRTPALPSQCDACPPLSFSHKEQQPGDPGLSRNRSPFRMGLLFFVLGVQIIVTSEDQRPSALGSMALDMSCESPVTRGTKGRFLDLE